VLPFNERDSLSLVLDAEQECCLLKRDPLIYVLIYVCGIYVCGKNALQQKNPIISGSFAKNALQARLTVARSLMSECCLVMSETLALRPKIQTKMRTKR